MKKTPITLIKLGGSLITHKRDIDRIGQYLDQIDHFTKKRGSLASLTEKISDLMNFQNMNEIFQVLSSFLQRNTKSRFVLVHGAGAIGHSLVLHLLKSHSDLQKVFPIIKLAVAIQNQIVVSKAIEYGISAISFPSHPILSGRPTDGVSSKAGSFPDLSVLEQIITETDAIPIFYGDVGYTPNGWKVFSGDIYPAALLRRIKVTRLDSAIFLTNIEGKRTGIYTKDPNNDDAEFISRIEVDNNNIEFFNTNNKILSFQGGETKSDFDVTDTMGGKLQNIIELAKARVDCCVVDISEFEHALNGETVGTKIISKKPIQATVSFLGTGDAFASDGRKSASIFIEIGDQGILLDCGPNSLQTFKKSGRTTNDVDIIIITHYHGDHFGGIPFFLLEARIQQNRKKPITIIGPPDIDKKVKDLYSILYGASVEKERTFPINYLSITPTSSPLKVDNIVIKAFKMLHTDEAQGYRVETKDVSIGYSGDTGWTEELVPLVKNTQLGILECCFFEEEHEIHLNYFQTKKLSSLTNTLALVHLGSEVYNRVQSLETNNILIPDEGQEIWI